MVRKRCLQGAMCPLALPLLLQWQHPGACWPEWQGIELWPRSMEWSCVHTSMCAEMDAVQARILGTRYGGEEAPIDVRCV
jgi:hypothetical protein